MITLQIHLLGNFHLSDRESPERRLAHGVTTPRLQSLLTYLLVHRHAPQVRQHIAFTFWPDASEAQALNNLRQLLFQLRHALPNAEQFLRVDANTIWWSPTAATYLDVAEFETAVEFVTAADRSTAIGADLDAERGELLQTLQAAFDIYRGDLLPSCYDEWIRAPRERLRQQCRLICQRLTQLLEEQRNYVAALGIAQRLLQLDDLDETTYLALMRLHALNNDRASALRVYEECAARLKQELEANPSAELQVAHARLRQSEAHTSIQAELPAEVGGSLPLIGRQAAWKRLRALWEHARRGQPSLALVTGEAGIGKSRLAEELYNWASRQGIVAVRTRAYAAEGRLAYAPISEWLRSSPVAPALAQLDTVWRSEIARLLPELLIADPALPAPAPLTEHWQRQRLFEALARGILAVNAPILLLIDDLQWCDQETLEWLHFLLRFDLKARLLILATARIEEMGENQALVTLVRALQSSESLIEFPLVPLGAAEVANLAASIVGRELHVTETQRLFSETEGNPLFVVEIVRAAEWGSEAQVQETSGVQALDSSLQSLPPKVYAVIAGRLSRLSPLARELAGIAATAGRAFTLDVLAHACDTDEGELTTALDELWRRRIIRMQTASAYDFSHDKLRDVAYGELSPIQQRRLHRRVAMALEAVHAADLEPLCAQLAAHYERAGHAATAINYYLRAGGIAQRIYATQEATYLFNRGLALLTQLPQGEERNRRELALQTALVAPLATNAGYASSDLIQACDRSRTLAQLLHEAPDTSVLRGLAIGSVVRNELQQAQGLGEQLLALAKQGGDSVLFTEAYYVLGVTTFFQGEFCLSRQHLEQAVANYAPERSPIHIARYSQDPKVVCLSRLALTLWYLGCFEQAERTLQEALDLAYQLAHPFSLVYCLFWSAMYHQHCGNVSKTLDQAEACAALANEHRFDTFRHLALPLRGWALAEQGNAAEATAQQQAAIEQAYAIGAKFQRRFQMGLLAEQYSKQGETARGLQLVNQVLESGGDHWCEPDLWRCKGEILLKSSAEASATAAAERSFLHAIALARRQEAKAVELRAAMSLARRWANIGRCDAACELLLPIYRSFSEGFETPILREARALLCNLA